MMKQFLTIILITISSVAMAQPMVTEKSASYYLPKTALRFALQVEKTTYTPGIFCKYVEQYYHIKGVVQHTTTKYAIVNLGLTSIGVLDTTRLYNIMLRGKNLGADIKLSPEGQFLAFNAEPMVMETRPPFKPFPKPAPIDNTKYLPRAAAEAPTDSARVDQTVRYMIKLQENINHLKAGEPVDSTCTETLEQLQERNEGLDALFFGTTTTDTVEQVIVIMPDQEMERKLMFRLNQKTGHVGVDEQEGTPYFLSIKDMHSTPKRQEELPKEKKIGCVYAVVPGLIKATIHREDEFLGSFDLYAAQFGFIDELSGSLFKNYTTHIILNPITGSVEKIKADM